MAECYEYLKLLSSKTLAFIESEFKSQQQPQSQRAESSSKSSKEAVSIKIHSIVEEDLTNSKTNAGTKLHRIFVESNNPFDNYQNTGWILLDEVTSCMICNQGLSSYFQSKANCAACGIVVCKACIPYRKYIFELSALGPLKICKNCFSGPQVSLEFAFAQTFIIFLCVISAGDYSLNTSPKKTHQTQILAPTIVKFCTG